MVSTVKCFHWVPWVREGFSLTKATKFQPTWVNFGFLFGRHTWSPGDFYVLPGLLGGVYGVYVILTQAKTLSNCLFLRSLLVASVLNESMDEMNRDQQLKQIREVCRSRRYACQGCRITPDKIMSISSFMLTVFSKSRRRMYFIWRRSAESNPLNGLVGKSLRSKARSYKYRLSSPKLPVCRLLSVIR